MSKRNITVWGIAYSRLRISIPPIPPRITQTIGVGPQYKRISVDLFPETYDNNRKAFGTLLKRKTPELEERYGLCSLDEQSGNIIVHKFHAPETDKRIMSVFKERITPDKYNTTIIYYVVMLTTNEICDYLTSFFHNYVTEKEFKDILNANTGFKDIHTIINETIEPTPEVVQYTDTNWRVREYFKSL